MKLNACRNGHQLSSAGPCKQCRSARNSRYYLKHREPITIAKTVPYGFKKCSKCRQLLPLVFFKNQSSTCDGKYSSCRGCNTAYRRNNKSKIKAQRIKHRLANKEKIYTYQNAWAKKNPGKRRMARRRGTQKATATLNNAYVRHLLRLSMPVLCGQEIPYALIVAKRLQMKVVRLIKEKPK